MRALHVTEIWYLPYLRRCISCGLCTLQKSGTIPTSLYFMRALFATEIRYRTYVTIFHACSACHRNEVRTVPGTSCTCSLRHYICTSQKLGTVPTSLYFMRALLVTEIRYLGTVPAVPATYVTTFQDLPVLSGYTEIKFLDIS
jgi:hypothetical protein